MNDREQAEQAMAAAKRRLTQAALATLRQWPLAEVMTADALAAVQRARETLRALEAKAAP